MPRCLLAIGLTLDRGESAAAGSGAGFEGVSARDNRAIAGFTGWQRLQRRPRSDLRSLGSAHPGTKRIYVSRTRARLAPLGRQRFPYPVGTVIVKTGSDRSGVRLLAIMRKVARGGSRDGGWDYVEYQRPSGAEPFSLVGGGEGVCTGCHMIAFREQRTDWVFYRLR